MPTSKQLFLLRKQYDAKSQKLMEVAKKQRGIIESIQDDIYKLNLKVQPANADESNMGNFTSRSTFDQRQNTTQLDKNIKKITSDEDIQYFRRNTEEVKTKSYIPVHSNGEVG